MRLGKRILRSEPIQVLLVRLAAVYLQLLYRTTRWMMVQPPASRDLVAKGRPVIACFWHGRMVVMHAAAPRGGSVHMLVSGHRDGQLIARAIAHMGVRTVTVSSKGGGGAALRAMQRLLREGHSVAVTPDGPRGPRMRAKMGAIKTAQISGAPIVPLSGTVSRRRILGSWDRFCLALPFARGVIYWGEPVYVPRHADAETLERLRLDLETRLNALTAEADRHFGQPEIQPAELGQTAKGTRHARA